MLLLLAGLLHGLPAYAASPDSGIGTGLESYDIPDKGGDKPPSSIDVAVPDGSTGAPDYDNGDTAEPGPPASGGDDGGDGNDGSRGGTGPGGVNTGDGTNSGVTTPGGTNPGGANPGGADPGDTNPGGADPGDADPNGGAGDSPDGNGTGTGTPGTTDPGGTDTPDTGDGDTDSGDTGEPGTDSGDTESGDTESGSGSTPDSDNPNSESGDSGKPWYQTLWEGTVQFSKGAGAGLIGAVVVVVVIVAVAAIIGVTFGAPVIIAALVVGAIAGGIYALVAGDAFDFVKAMGIGGLAAGFVLTLGHAGVFAAARGAFQLVRSAGLKQALQMAGTRILAFSRTALVNLKNTFLNVVKHPLAALKESLVSKTFYFSTTINVFINVGFDMVATGEFPTPLKTLGLVAESAAGAFVFDRIGAALGAAANSGLGKRVSAMVAQSFEGLIVSLAKQEKTDGTTVAAQGFFKGFVLQTLFGGRFNRLRTDENIGTAFSDLGVRTVDDIVPNNSRTITNVELNRIWNDTANTNNINRWDNSGNPVTQQQWNQLQQNQQALDKLSASEGAMQESAEVSGDKVINEADKALEGNGQETANEKGSK